MGRWRLLGWERGLGIVNCRAPVAAYRQSAAILWAQLQFGGALPRRRYDGKGWNGMRLGIEHEDDDEDEWESLLETVKTLKR
jgi:hypothetical protein